MGYACPVCDAPQRDAEHLANHLALTAMVHGADHEAWLDEHAPDWAESGPVELGGRVAPLADEAPYDEVFENTVRGHVGGGDHGRGDVGGHDAPPAPPSPDDDATREALAEARELTRRMLGGDDATAAGSNAPKPDAPADDDPTTGPDDAGATGDGADDAGGGTAEADAAEADADDEKA